MQGGGRVFPPPPHIFDWGGGGLAPPAPPPPGSYAYELGISGISVVNWSHKCDQKYSSYELFAFTCDNLSQPSVTYRNPIV